LAAAETIAHDLVAEGATLLFGGGKTGLMGHLATCVLEHGGKVQGVMPHLLREIEMNHPGVKDFTFVHTMAERKALLLHDTAGLVAMPGGTGTLDELIEAVTLKRLGQYLQPIVLLNQDGFYDSLVELIDRMVREEFMNPEHRNLWTVVNHASEVVSAVKNTPLWDADAVHRAAVR
jgi:uncharacterized protein (TIGR00730 family)